VLSDNGSAYKSHESHAWRDACQQLGIRPKKTRPYRPQTNGRVERFHGTLADGSALGRFYSSEQARRKALPPWLHFYNHHRLHTATGYRLPATSHIPDMRITIYSWSIRRVQLHEQPGDAPWRLAESARVR
jgi:transposase InsO family protein